MKRTAPSQTDPCPTWRRQFARLRHLASQPQAVPTPIMPPENTALTSSQPWAPFLTCSPPWSLQAGLRTADRTTTRGSLMLCIKPLGKPSFRKQTHHGWLIRLITSFPARPCKWASSSFVPYVLLSIQLALQKLCFYANFKNYVYCLQGQTTVFQGFTYFKLLLIFLTKFKEFFQIFFSFALSLFL